MSDPIAFSLQMIDAEHRHEPAATRRGLIVGAGAALAGLGLLKLPGTAAAAPSGKLMGDPQEILNTAASVEVLATCINTIAHERGLGGDDVTKRNIAAAGRHELEHHNQLVNRFGAKPADYRVWIPDAVFASRTSLLRAVQNGDGIFINIYLIATTVFGNAGNGRVARASAEIMGVEAVHGRWPASRSVCSATTARTSASASPRPPSRPQTWDGPASRRSPRPSPAWRPPASASAARPKRPEPSTISVS